MRVPEAAGSPLLPDFKMVLKIGLKRLTSRKIRIYPYFSFINWSPKSGAIFCFRTEAFWVLLQKNSRKKIISYRKIFFQIFCSAIKI
jgi:hypothetical protein